MTLKKNTICQKKSETKKVIHTASSFVTSFSYGDNYFSKQVIDFLE